MYKSFVDAISQSYRHPYTGYTVHFYDMLNHFAFPYMGIFVDAKTIIYRNS